MKIFIFTKVAGIFIILLMLSSSVIADELFSTTFGHEENWDNPGGAWGAYNEKTYAEGDWFFHSTSAVRGTPGHEETYDDSPYAFRDRDVFTLYNTANVSEMTGFSLQLRDWMDGSGEQRDLKISLDGGDSWETLITINKDWFDEYQVYQEYAYVFPDGPKSFDAEEFQLRITGGGDTNNGRINIGQYVAQALDVERTIVILTPEEGDTFHTYDEVSFSWEAENISELLFERFREGEDDPYYSEVLPGDQEEITFEVPNGAHGSYFFRVSDNNDPSFFEESERFEIIDDVDPSLTDKEPQSGSENIGLEPTLKMFFDEDVFAGDGHIAIYRHDDDDLVLEIPADGDQVTMADDEVHVQIDEELDHETTYYVHVDDDAIVDIAGNYFEGVADPLMWTFTTEIMEDPDAIICNGDFEHWTNGLPDCWYGEKSNIGADKVNQYEADVYTRSFSVQLVNDSDSHRRFTSQHVNLEEGLTYQITFWIKGQGEIRTGLFDDRETSHGYAPYNSYIDADPDSWKEHAQLVSAVNTSDIGEFIFSVRNTSDEHILLDNVRVEVYEDEPGEMENIAALRAGALDTPYTLTGEAILTYQMDYRNQKFIQDETAAILIDDDDGVITTIYERYDGITGITGMLTEHNNMLQFVPMDDPGEAISTGLELTPEHRQLADLTADDQAMLVELTMVTFEDAGSTFDTGTNYTIYDPSGSGEFRTAFFDADYIDDEIPHQEQTVVVLVHQYQDNIQVTARDWDDFEVWVSVPEIDGEDFIVYPNPFHDHIRVSVAENLEMVQLINAQGQLVREVQAPEGDVLIPANELQPGIYFIQLQFMDGRIGTKKIMKQ